MEIQPTVVDGQFSHAELERGVSRTKGERRKKLKRQRRNIFNFPSVPSVIFVSGRRSAMRG
jgi:hypothetical protein